MDYEKLYKEANKKVTVRFGSNVAKELFPDLYESEDERIRKEIISALKYANCKGVYDKHIAWLEKQGEQKYIDKVIPKFHVGNWVVFKDKHESIYQVEKIEGGYYILRHTYGGTFRVCVLHDEDLRLWTINDAKDGDVLATENFIFIFKNIDGGNGVHYYCQYEISKHEDDNQFDIALPQSLMGRVGNSISHYSPATKEQRDLLFQKMKEAGYEWDAKKKELKKIEQKPAWSEEDEIFVHGLIRGLAAKKNIHGHTTFSSDNIDITKTIDWLEFLKYRVQPQTAWCNEDDEDLYTIANNFMPEPSWNAVIETKEEGSGAFAYDYNQMVNMFKAGVNWFKSLKEKYTWKPSDEQINAIRLARSFVTDDFSENPTLSETLIELEKQLKKLREE